MRQVRVGLLSLCILAGILFYPGGSSLVHASDAFSPLPRAGNGSSTLFPNSGSIQYHPKVYLDFWGSKWQNDVDGIIPQVQATFQALAGSSYNNILSQYNDTTSNPQGYVHNDVQLMGTWVDAGDSVGNYISMLSDVAGEEKNAAVHFGLNTADESAMHDVQILVFPQNGTSYDTLFGLMSYCGMHYYDSTSHIAYGLVVYSTATSCGNTETIDTNDNIVGGSIAESIAWNAVHEYAETATDQYIHGTITTIWGGGWQTNDTGASPNEVADVCEAYVPIFSSGNAYIWNNHTNAYYLDSSGNPMLWPFYSSGNVLSPKESSQGPSYQFFLPFLWSNAAAGSSPNGCVMSAGQQYSSPDALPPFHGVHTVQGPILKEYQAVGADQSVLGSPVTEQMPISSGGVSYFNGGCGGLYKCAAIYSSAGSTSAHFVRASEFQEYVALGEANGVLGFPITDDASINGGSVTYFAATPCGSGGPNGSGGAIYWSAATGSHEAHGCIYHEYAVNQNGPSGRLGFPVSDEYTNSAGYRESDFQGGNIQWVNGVAYTQLYPHCVNPTAMYGRTGGNWNLWWYGNADPSGGSSSWASGTGNTVGTNWAGSVFSGGNGIIYRIDSNNNLWWYKHLGASNGTFNWQGGKQVGNGWGFSYVFSAGNGIIYAVDNAGNLRWYDHLGYADGSSSWASGSGAIVSTGWGYSSTGLAYAFSGGNGIIYTVSTDGTLHWHRHLGYLSGSWDWASGSGKTIGTGWGATNGVIDAFSAGGGIIFAVRSNGTLYWYDHLDYQSGGPIWANSGSGKQIGIGWDSLLGMFADVNACQ